MRVKVYRKRLTLPEAARRKLELDDAGELELELTGDGVLLRSAAARRRAAYRRIQAAQKRARYVGAQPRPAAEEEERQIAELATGRKPRR